MVCLIAPGAASPKHLQNGEIFTITHDGKILALAVSETSSRAVEARDTQAEPSAASADAQADANGNAGTESSTTCDRDAGGAAASDLGDGSAGDFWQDVIAGPVSPKDVHSPAGGGSAYALESSLSEAVAQVSAGSDDFWRDVLNDSTAAAADTTND